MPTQQMHLGGGGSETIGNQSDPAVNGKVINAAGRPTGWYWIKTSSMSSASPVYINNTDEGGGWMLIKYDYGTNTTSNGVNYPNFFSHSSVPSGTFGSSNLDIASAVYDLWYHNSTAQVDEQMMMWSNSTNRNPNISNMNTAAKVDWGTTSSNFVNANISGSPGSQNATTTTGTMLQGTSTELKNLTTLYGSSGGTLTVSCSCDWLYNSGTGFYWMPCGPSDNLDSPNGRSGNGHGTGMWMNSSSNDFYGGIDVHPTNSNQNTGNNSFALYIR